MQPLSRKKILLLVAVVVVLVVVGFVVKAYLSDYVKGRHFRQLGLDLASTLDQWETEARRAQSGRRLAALSLCGELMLLEARYDKLKKQKVPLAVGQLRADYDALVDRHRAFAEGEDILDGVTTPLLTGYVSEVDDSIQYFSLNLPKGYSPERRWPLLVSLHGHGGFTYRYYQGHPVKHLAGAISVAPYGRGPSDYMYLGELDVLAVIDTVSAHYAVDPARVYCMGNSMGGTGSWNMAVHYPDRFAAISPQVGNADDQAWTDRWGWNTRPDPAHDDIRTYMTRINSPSTFAENLRHVPVYCIHGSADPVVPVEHSRLMVERLRHELDYTILYREFLGAGHGGMPGYVQDERIGFLGSYWQHRPPRHITFTTAKLRHGRAYWLRLTQLARPMELARVDALVTGPNRIDIRADNVLRMTLQMSAELVNLKQESVVTVNGQVAFRGAPGRAMPVHLAEIDGRWRTVRYPTPEGFAKAPGLEGPIDEVMLAPFMVVYPDNPNPPEADYLRPENPWYDEAQRFIAMWKTRFGAEPRHRPVSRFTPSDASKHNLVIFGRPDQLPGLEGVLAGLPAKVDNRTLEVGGRRFEGTRLGLMMCYPNPSVPGRMVAWITGTEGSAYQAWARFGNWFNWGIYDNRKWFDLAVYDARSHNPETYLWVGWFGSDWSFERGRFFDGLAAIRDMSPPQGLPVPLFELSGASVSLSSVRPDKIDQFRGAVGFDRSYRGWRLTIGDKSFDKGLGVRAPSTLTYTLGGRADRLTGKVGLQAEPFERVTEERASKCKTVFEIVADGKVVFRSDELQHEEPGPVEFDVDLAGVNKLVLKTRSGGGPLWLHGSSTWAEPVLHLKTE